MQECWPWPGLCFRRSVTCRASDEVHASLATILQARHDRAAIGEGLAPARCSSRSLATPADRQFSLFSATLRLVEGPDTAFEKREAVCGLVGDDDDAGAWIDSRGRGGNRSWSVYWCLSAT